MKIIYTADDISKLSYEDYTKLDEPFYYASLNEKDRLFYEFMTKDSDKLEFTPGKKSAPVNLSTNSLLNLQGRVSDDAYISQVTYGYMKNDNGFRSRSNYNVKSLKFASVEIDIAHLISGRKLTQEEFNKILDILKAIVGIIKHGSHGFVKYSIPNALKPTAIGFTGRGIILFFKLKGNGIEINEYTHEVVQRAYSNFTERASIVYDELCRRLKLTTLDGQPLVCDKLAQNSFNRVCRSMGTINTKVNAVTHIFHFEARELDFLDYLNEAINSLSVSNKNKIDHREDLKRCYLNYTNMNRYKDEYKLTLKNPDREYHDNLMWLWDRANQMIKLSLLYLQNFSEVGHRYYFIRYIIMSVMTKTRRSRADYNKLIDMLVEFDNNMPRSWYKDYCAEYGADLDIRTVYHKTIQEIMKSKFKKDSRWIYGMSGKLIRKSLKPFWEVMSWLVLDCGYSHEQMIDEFKYLFDINERKIARDNTQMLTKFFIDATLETLFHRETDDPKELKQIIKRKLISKIQEWQCLDIHWGLMFENFDKKVLNKFTNMSDKVFNNLLERFVYPTIELNETPRNFTEFVRLFSKKNSIYRINKRTGKARKIAPENRKYKLDGNKFYLSAKECIDSLSNKIINFVNQIKKWNIPTVDKKLVEIAKSLKEKIFYRENGEKGFKAAKAKWQKEYDNFKLKVHRKGDFIYVEDPKTGEMKKEFRPVILFNELYRKDQELYKYRNEYILQEFDIKFTDRKRYKLLHVGNYETGELTYFRKLSIA